MNGFQTGSVPILILMLLFSSAMVGFVTGFLPPTASSIPAWMIGKGGGGKALLFTPTLSDTAALPVTTANASATRRRGVESRINISCEVVFRQRKSNTSHLKFRGII